MELTYGDGYGYGYGSGDGYGYGSGYGDGDGYGYGDGSGYGYGYGSGYGDGDGSGYGDGEFELSKDGAWEAYHYILKQKGKYVLRSGEIVKKEQELHEDEIELCEYGLHASLCPEDAKQYAPKGSVLTKVKIWGMIKIQRDKLVATDRMIVEEITN